MRTFIILVLAYLGAAIYTDPVSFDLTLTQWSSIWTYAWITLFFIPAALVVAFLPVIMLGGVAAVGTAFAGAVAVVLWGILKVVEPISDWRRERRIQKVKKELSNRPR